MNDQNVSAYLETACEAARRGAAVLEHWRGKFQVREKGRADLVSEADLESQKTIQSFFQEQFPEHLFLGEEDPTAEKRPEKDSPPVWIVDPLDGTTNYVHDVPAYAVSIGLWMDEEMVVGVVYDPSRDEMFRAAKGQGAWINDTRIQVSETREVARALIGVGFPPDLTKHREALHWFDRYSFAAQSLRRTGSTALNLAYVAAGRFDGFWAFDNHVWDVDGGVVLILEAGGLLTNIDGPE